MHHIADDAPKRHHRDRKPHGHRIIVDKHDGKGRPPSRARENERAKRAYKPGSVADGHLSWRARHRAAPRTLPGRGPGRPIAPLFALAPDGVYQAVALPRRWWSLTPPFQLFPLRAESARRWESSFLRHFPSGRPHWPLASILPCGARTFLTPAPERRSRDRLARFARGIVASDASYGAQASNPHEANGPTHAKLPVSASHKMAVSEGPSTHRVAAARAAGDPLKAMLSPTAAKSGRSERLSPTAMHRAGSMPRSAQTPRA